ncbi:hypothetical protein ACHAXA_005557 [Cyclostephanos tholiformis]|uniref:Uncharacterized protein n=1 Tax=Cyclostephanos tholiformis TaxID=382380 RepID=A0ABD3RJE9_9STRA
MSDEASSLKPGQKFPTPTPGNGDRVFYETLLGQRPDSEMAQEWCVLYGVMEEEDAARAYKRMIKRKGGARAGGGGGGAQTSSAAAAATKRKSAGSTGKIKRKKKKKNVLDDVEYDAGIGAGGDEGIGIAAL